MLIELQGFGLVNSMLAGKLSDKTSFPAERAGGEKGSVLIARLCLTAALTQTKLQPHDPHLPYYILQLFPSTALCVCLPRDNRDSVVTALSDAAVYASDVFT